MASTSVIPGTCKHVRSSSMPSRSHPNINKIEEVLLKLKTISTSTPKAEDICNHLSGLGKLYDCISNLLCLPLIQQEFYDHEKEVNEMLDESVRLLDMCSTSRDTLSTMKQHVQNLQSTLRRRRNAELSMENEVHAYMCFRKKFRTVAAKGVASLKRMNTKSTSSLSDMDDQLPMVIRVLREVTVFTISIFQSLLTFISAPMTKTRKNVWSLVSKVMCKGQVACEGLHEEANEVVSVDDALYISQDISGQDDLERVQRAQNGLKALEASIEGIDAGLECLFRHLIQNRVSILNILTH